MTKTCATKLGLTKLRELAEKATPGEWTTGCMGTDSSCQCPYILNEGFAGAIATIHVDNGLRVGDGGNDAPKLEEAIANMGHIAAANPETIIALLDRIEALEKALKPFADAADGIDPSDADGWLMWEHPQANEVNVGDLRRAAAAMKGDE